MRRAIIAPNGTLLLGDQAAAHGFVPGAVVDIVLSSASGVLLVLLNDSPPPLDVAFRPLVGGTAQLASRRQRSTARREDR